MSVFTGITQSANVLIVDDDPGARAATVTALGKHNQSWKIFEAATIIEAENLLKSRKASDSFDVVLTDLVLGNDFTGGVTVLERAKQLDPLLMVVIFTAQEKRLDRIEAFRLGAFDCIQKNMIGARAWQEISVKANTAISFRRLMIDSLHKQKEIELYEFERSINIVRQFFDPRILAAARENPSLLEVQERVATIAFWDIRGFSRLCEALKAHKEEIVKFLEGYYDLALDATTKNKGIIDKFIGDGAMAVFCDFSSSKQDDDLTSLQAVQAALTFRSKFQERIQQWQRRWSLLEPQKIEIGLGCGIHTGKMLVGIIGMNSRSQFTAIGPGVNLAARMASRSIGGEILISTSVNHRLPSNIKRSKSRSIDDFKGIAGEFSIFSVLP